MSDSEHDEFFITLLFDTVHCLERFKIDDSQTVRRDLVRTVFAALEADAWSYRLRTIEIVESIDALTPDELNALCEWSYFVNEKGQTTKQPKYLSLTSHIRLVTRIAERVTSTETIDFSKHQWESIRKAILIRNRVTHPKSVKDLLVTDEDVAQTIAALYWFAEQSLGVQEGLISAMGSYVDELKSLLAMLESGDEEAKAQYDVIKGTL